MLGYNAWAVAVGLVTLDCVKGLGGPADLLYILFGINLRLVDKFLSWGVFQPLAKISYMMYLVHITVINNVFLNTRTYSMEHTNFSEVCDRTLDPFLSGILINHHFRQPNSLASLLCPSPFPWCSP